MKFNSKKQMLIAYVFSLIFMTATITAAAGVDNQLVKNALNNQGEEFLLEPTIDTFTLCGESLTFSGVTRSTNLIQDALLAPFATPLQDPCGELDKWAMSEAPVNQAINYSRYWHGSGSLFRIFAVLTTVNVFKFLVVFALFFAIAYFLVSSARRKSLLVSSVFTVSLLSLIQVETFVGNYPYAIPLAISFVFASLVARETVERNVFFIVFLSGAWINFFDLITTPVLYMLVTVFPALLTNFGDRTKDKVVKILLLPILWFAGYFTTWLIKWVLADVFGRRGELGVAIGQATWRTQGEVSDGSEVSAVSAIDLNLATFLNEIGNTPITFIATVLFIIALAVLLFRRKYDKLLDVILISTVAAWPFIWFFVVQNHSIIHHWMTNRSIAGSVALLFSASVAVLLSEKNKRDSKHRIVGKVEMGL